MDEKSDFPMLGKASVHTNFTQGGNYSREKSAIYVGGNQLTWSMCDFVLPWLYRRYSNLDPKLTEDDMQDLVRTSLSSVVSCLPDDQEPNLLMMEKTLMALGDLLKELLVNDMTVKTLDVLIQVDIWYCLCPPYYGGSVV